MRRATGRLAPAGVVHRDGVCQDSAREWEAGGCRGMAVAERMLVFSASVDGQIDVLYKYLEEKTIKVT